jgi:hypothetical protein
MIRVYVAGKYSANNVLDVLKNIGHGRRVCAELFALGYSPFVPGMMQISSFRIHPDHLMFNSFMSIAFLGWPYLM